eukprot:scaffold39_cov142-Chaetoceros_neogracile.AAC.2
MNSTLSPAALLSGFEQNCVNDVISTDVAFWKVTNNSASKATFNPFVKLHVPSAVTWAETI